MARKSASPFYGLNNMLAVDEEEDEGGWGMVSSFPTNLKIEQIVKYQCNILAVEGFYDRPEN